MTQEQAYARMIRTGRALSAATRAGLDGPQLEPFEVQAADAWAYYATLWKVSARESWHPQSRRVNGAAMFHLSAQHAPKCHRRLTGGSRLTRGCDIPPRLRCSLPVRIVSQVTRHAGSLTAHAGTGGRPGARGVTRYSGTRARVRRGLPGAHAGAPFEYTYGDR